MSVRTRVARIVRGDFVPDDFREIFLSLRERNDFVRAFPLVTEVGDFCAHRVVRDKGVAWQHIRDLSLAFQLHMLGTGINVLPSRPSWFDEALEASVRQCAVRELRKDGLTSSKALNAVKSILQKLNAEGHVVGIEANNELALSGPTFSGHERKVFHFLANTYRVMPMTTSAALEEGLSAMLIKLGHLDRSDRAAFGRCKTHLSLFAASNMHQTVFVEGRTNEAPRFARTFLSSRQGSGSPTLEVKVAFDFATIEGAAPSTASTGFFDCGVEMDEHISDELKVEMAIADHVASEVRLTEKFVLVPL